MSHSSLPPPRFAKPFETIGHSNTLGGGSNSSPAGLARTPPPSSSAAAASNSAAGLNSDPQNNSNTTSGTAASRNFALEQQNQHQHIHIQSLLNVKEAAQRDKTLLMHRIEELSKTIHELQRRSSVQTEELESYHRAFGSLDDFTSRQVRVREELVVLRDAVRQWQDRESDARQEVSRLGKVLDAVRRGQRHASGESRLKDIEERLAMAHLQRNDIAKEIDDIVEMERTKRERHAVLLQRHAGIAAGGGGDPQMLAAELAAAAPGVDGSYLNWQMRGKLADLKRLLRQKDDAIESLQKAADSLHQVSRSDRFLQIGAVNRECPGCGELPWKSAFCPETGHKHLAFDPNINREKELEREKAMRAPIFQPLSEEEITQQINDLLLPEIGSWTMLREVGGSNSDAGGGGLNSRRSESGVSSSNQAGGAAAVLYREKGTGRIVEDLRALVEQNHLNAHETKVKEYEAKLRDERLRREAEEIESAKDPVPHLAVQPSMKTEILSLTAALEAKKDENMRLRALLEEVCSSGAVGAKSGIASLASMANLVRGDDDGRMQAEMSEDGSPLPPPAGSPPGSPSASGVFSSPGADNGDSNAPRNQQQQQPQSRGQLFRGVRSVMTANRLYPNADDKQRAASPSSPDGGSGGGGALAALQGETSATVTLHDEDDVQTFTKMMRLQRENAALGKRASELVLALVERDDHVNQLREALGRSNAMDSDRYVAQLRREAAQLRDRLLQEERRAANLEQEVGRLKRFEPRAFQNRQ